jgi:hypothetical protein
MKPFEGREPVRMPVENDQVPPRHVRTVYHYTSATNWRQIQQEGVLKPLRPAMTLGFVFNDVTRPISKEKPELRSFWEGEHIVGGVDASDFGPWREFGDHDRLLEFVSKGTGRVVLLSFPAYIVRGAVLLDHYHDSVRKRKGVFGRDPLEDPDSIDRETRQKISELSAQYFRSAVRGLEYDGSFRVPEIWIPHSINLSDLTVEKDGTIEDFR